jgi:hypothetical protein
MLQRKNAPPADTLAQQGATPAAFVETEIGALPADLWQIVGERPPATTIQRQVEATGVTERPRTDDGHLAHTSATPSERAPSIEKTVRPHGAARMDNVPAMQKSAQSNRQSDRDATPSDNAPRVEMVASAPVTVEPTASIQRESAPASDSAEGEEVDTDALAHAVYQQIKRQLSVEWERQYRR